MASSSSTNYSKATRRRSSLSDSATSSLSRRSSSHNSFDAVSTFGFGGFAVLPQVRRASRERLSTIASQDGDEREIAKQVKSKTLATENQIDAAAIETAEEEGSRRISPARAQLHPSTRQPVRVSGCTPRQPSLAMSSPVLGQAYFTPPALLRPASSYRHLQNYFRWRQITCFNSLNLLPPAPDGGWGWVVVVAALITTTIVHGIMFSFAPILIHLTSEAPHKMLDILFMGVVLISSHLLVCPLAMSLINMFGCRIVLLTGSLISASGFSLSAFFYADSCGAPPSPKDFNITNYSESMQPVSYVSLILSYGLLSGIGLGLMELAAVVGLSQYFELKRTLAMGVALCGSGIGICVFPFFISCLLEYGGFDLTIAYLAGIALNGCCAVLLFRPLKAATPPPHSHHRKITQTAAQHIPLVSTTSEPSSSNIRMRQMSLNELDNHVSINTEDPGDPDPQDSITRLKAKLAVVLPPPQLVAAAKSEQKLNRTHQRQQQQPVALFTSNPNRRFQVTARPPLSPQGAGPNLVNLSDLLRPFYRIDILYCRSVTHLPMCRINGTNSMAEYRSSAFQIPEDTWSSPDSSPFKRTLVRLVPKPMLDPIRLLSRDTFVLLRNTAFIRAALGSALCMMAAMLIFFVLPWWALVLKRQDGFVISPRTASCLITIIGGSSIAGRLASGFVADLPKGSKVLLLHNMALYVMTSVTLVAHLITNFVELCVMCVVFGFCYSFHMALGNAVLGEVVDVDHGLTSAFNILSICRGLAPLCIIPLLPELLGTASFCVSESGSCPPLPANSMPLACLQFGTWWALVPHPPPQNETITTLTNPTNGYRRFLLLTNVLLFVASAIFASLHFRPVTESATDTQRRLSTRGSSSSTASNRLMANDVEV